MRSVEKWLLGSLSACVGATGIAYLWMKYFMQAADPFAVVNHPWQPYVLYVHLLSAPALILVCGMVWTSHVSGKLSGGQPYSRRSGLGSIWSFTAMATSGYLLQVVTSESLQRAMVVAHVASGCAFLATYGVHLFIAVRRQLRERRRAQLRSAA
ncbi:MAG TPA: hypothetical protein VK886_13340 [Vicinamibacterales bacterium]|nr:hypothetical protein [Vicinamibacterales bacterium]